MVKDLEYAWRQVRKAPAFAATAILTLALSVGASVAIFAFVDAALLKPLPYRAPDRLVGVYESVAMFPQSNLSYLDYLDWKRTNTVLSALSAYQSSGVAITTPTGAQRAPGARVSDDFFRTLGVVPALGRDFSAGEDLPEAPRTVILSQAAWQARYGGRAEAVGSTVTLNGFPHTIVGVLPAGFHFAPVGDAEFWTTLHPAGGCDLRRSCHNLYGIGRLADGVSVATADAALKAIASNLERLYPDSNRGQGAVVVSLSEVIVGNIRPTLLVMLGGVALLMLLAAVNVSSLLLVRSEARRREIAVRRALGASTWRVARQFALEAIVLVAIGATAGLAVSQGLTSTLAGLVPQNVAVRMPFLHDAGLTARVWTFALAIAVLAVAAFAITPILHLALTKSVAALADRGTSGMAWRRMGSSLVVVELALAVVLLTGAGLLGQSVYRLLHVDLGMRTDELTTLGVAAPAGKYNSTERIAALGRDVVARLSALPGVRAVGLTSVPPLLGGNTMWIRVIGRPFNGEHNEVQYREVSSGYLQTLQARLVRGRHFSDADTASRPQVVIVNQAVVRQYFPNEDPLGKQLLYISGPAQPMEIVGVVDDVKEGAMDAPTAATIYVPFEQDPTRGFAVIVRTASAGQAILPTLTAAMHDLDPDISTFGGRTLTQMINESQSAYLRRSSASLVGGFAAVAWLLGVVGLYGVIAYSVSRRTREIGVRMALGAQRASVYGLIMGEASRLTAAGLAIGLAGAVAAATLLRSLLFGVRTWDLPTLAAVAVALGASALLASYVPARRAASVSPMDALRIE